MSNISKQKRDRMLAFLEELKTTHNDDASIRAFNEIENHIREKKYGLVWEEHTEEVDELLQANIPVFCEDKERRICKDENLPWNFIIEGDNLQALYLLEKTHKGKVDCIYIDPPYNTGAKDWKYNNDYVDGNDVYRHSKWLSMMKNRLILAKQLLNPENSVLICTIDEKEYLRLGCLLEELFPTAKIQMVSSVINAGGSIRSGEFSRTDEYIFFVMLGEAHVIPLSLGAEWRGGKQLNEGPVLWRSMLRGGEASARIDRPNMFYPVIVKKGSTEIIGIGESLPLNVDVSNYVLQSGTEAVWPIKKDGSEGRWRVGVQTARETLSKGYMKLNRIGNRMTISYLASGVVTAIENGSIEALGNGEDIDFNIIEEHKIIPGTAWQIPSHDASKNGTAINKKFLCSRKFSFPKSVYAVHDVMRFFLDTNPNAVVVDYFAGSGTTLHAVNLLNAEDGGHRVCIMATNNEVSLDEAKILTRQGYKKGDPGWEALGIAQYITWPRTACTIEGKDVNGNKVVGEYITYNNSKIKMSDGFKANVKYLKCDWIPRKPGDYLLSNALCLHIKEMIELQTGKEVDCKKNVLILNRDDFNRYIANAEIYNQIENIWVNQNMILSADEIKLLAKKGFKYIPREYFGHELREAAE